MGSEESVVTFHSQGVERDTWRDEKISWNQMRKRWRITAKGQWDTKERFLTFSDQRIREGRGRKEKRGKVGRKSRKVEQQQEEENRTSGGYGKRESVGCSLFKSRIQSRHWSMKKKVFIDIWGRVRRRDEAEERGTMVLLPTSMHKGKGIGQKCKWSLLSPSLFLLFHLFRCCSGLWVLPYLLIRLRFLLCFRCSYFASYYFFVYYSPLPSLHLPPPSPLSLPPSPSLPHHPFSHQRHKSLSHQESH